MSYDAATLAGLDQDAAQVISRYPVPRSALLPLLHLVQSVDGYVSPDGIAYCAQQLGLTEAEVSAVATFYTQFKRHPNGTYTLGVCTNTLCAIMGGDEIYAHLSEYLGIGHDETSADGMFTLERVECNAACDFAPVMMVNWEFFDNQTPASAQDVVDRLRAGQPVAPTRGPAQVCTFKQTSRLLAGFLDDHAGEGPAAGPASLRGLELAHHKGWAAPDAGTTGAASEAASDAGKAAGQAPAVQAAAGKEAAGKEAVGKAHSSADRPAKRGARAEGEAPSAPRRPSETPDGAASDTAGHTGKDEAK